MQKHEQNLAARINGNNLQPLAGATVTVTNNATGLAASLYQDDEVTPINSIVTDNNGYYGFKAPDGEYTLTFSGVRFATFTRQLILDDPSENPYATLAQLASPSGTTIINYGNRPLADKLDESISLSRFGGDPTGSALSTSAFEAAFDAIRNEIIDNSGTAGANSRSVDLVVAPGTYRMSPVLVPANVRIIGIGATIISDSDDPIFETGYYVGNVLTSNAALSDEAAITNRLVGLQFIGLTFYNVSRPFKLRAMNEQSGIERCRFYNCGVPWEAVQCFFSNYRNNTIRGVKAGFEDQERVQFGRATNRVTIEELCITGVGSGKAMRIGEAGPLATMGCASIVIRGGGLESLEYGINFVGEMVDVSIDGMYAENVSRAFFDEDGALKTHFNINPAYSNSTDYMVDMSGLQASEIGEFIDFSEYAPNKAKVRLREDTLGNYGTVVNIPPDAPASRYELSDGVRVRGINSMQTTGSTKAILSLERVTEAATEGLLPIHDRGWYGRVENEVVGSSTGTVQNSAGTQMLVLCNHHFSHTTALHYALRITPNAGSGAGGTNPEPIDLHGFVSGKHVTHMGTAGTGCSITEDPTYHVFRLHFTGFGASDTDPAFAWMRNGQYVSEGFVKLIG